jgi:hypothetical protein
LLRVKWYQLAVSAKKDSTNLPARTSEQVCADILATRGLPSEIARACGISAQSVFQWKKVPAHHVLTVSTLTHLEPEQIRPDVFRPKPPKPA